jgi:hypothetical protein
MAEIIKGLGKILRIKWMLHTAHMPQSSGKIKHMNRTVKNTLAKFAKKHNPPG